MSDDKDNVTPIVETGLDDLTPEQIAELAETADVNKKSQERIVGYILSPEVMVALLDVCEDIPGRYYKKLVPALQNSAQLVENEDGDMRILNT